MGGMSLLEILQPTNVPAFNPNAGYIHRAWEQKAPTYKAPSTQTTELTCRWCGKSKKLDKFVTCNKTKNGVSDTCKRCLSAKRKRPSGAKNVG